MTTRAASSYLAQSSPDSAESRVWAIVPVKVLSEAKQRLHSCLGDKREELTLAMLKDVLNALSDSELVDCMACVTADPMVAALAAGHGALVVDEERVLGMNRAIRLGIEAARKHGAGRVVVMPADLPLASGMEIDRMLRALQSETAADQPAVIGLSPAADGHGTNFLSLDARQPFETHFGDDSFQQHQACARAEHLPTLVLESSTLSFDIDCEQDLRNLISCCSRNPEFQSTNTWTFLLDSGLTIASAT